MLRTSSLCLLAFFLSTCGVSDESYTTGSHGRVQLELRSLGGAGVSDECFIACGFDRPFLRGTSEEIHVLSPEKHPRLRAQSMDPQAIKITRHDDTLCESNGSRYWTETADDCRSQDGFPGHALRLEITALAAGDTSLEIFTEDGVFYDSVPIQVRDAASLRIEQHRQHAATDWSYDEVSTVEFPSEIVKIHVLAFDGEGHRLQASSGIHLELSDEKVASFGGGTTAEDLSHVQLVAQGPGITTLTARSASVTTSIAVRGK